ncbi:hypothetical protein TNCV_2544551 [Trichonephila clavipes]|nr:hypothetical protein TNCV_2544551 [Trichonephila clavipes]
MFGRNKWVISLILEDEMKIRLSPSGSNDSSGIVNDNLCDSAKSDLRVSLVDNGLVGPYSATVLVTLSSAPDHRPARLSPLAEFLIFTIILRYRSVESDLRVSLVNNGLVGPYSATVLVTLPSAPDHRPPHLASAR